MADFSYVSQVFAKTIDLAGNAATVGCPASQVSGQGTHGFGAFGGFGAQETPLYTAFKMPGDGSTIFSANDNSTNNPALGGLEWASPPGFGEYYGHYFTEDDIPVSFSLDYDQSLLFVSGVNFATPRLDGKPDPESYTFQSGTFGGSSGQIVVTSTDSLYKYTITAQFAPVFTGAAKATYADALITFSPFSVFYTITVTRQQIAPFVDTTTKVTLAGYKPSIRGAISLATGGSPRLFLALARAYQELLVTEVNLGGVWTIQVTANYTNSAVRVCRSGDFGETFEPGIDIGAESFFDSQPIADGRFTTASVGPVGWSPGQPIPSPLPDFCLPAITQFMMLPHGRLYVNGTHQGTGFPQDWSAARLTDDISGQSGWRDSQTPNRNWSKTFSGQLFGFPTGNLQTENLQTLGTAATSAWLTSGSYQGTKGGGGKSGGPSQMRGMSGSGGTALNFWASTDGGDTWSIETPPTPPAGFQLFARGATDDACIFQKGQAYDGRRYSSTGFEGWTFYKPGPGDFINMQAVGVPNPSPFPGTFWLARSAEGEVVRAIVQNNRGAGLALSSVRYGFGTGFKVSDPTQVPGGFIRAGGSGLAAGTYQVGITWLSNGVYGPLGETLISPLETWVLSGSVNQIVVFLTEASGPGVGMVEGRAVANVYVSDAPGSSTLRLVGSVGANDLSTFVIDALPAGSAPEPPSANSTGPVLAQPAGTILNQGTYWDAAQPIMVSATGDGLNLAPLPFSVPVNSGFGVQAWAWQQRVVLALAVDDTVAILVTENAGSPVGWWRYTVYSQDNGETWQAGKPPKW